MAESSRSHFQHLEEFQSFAFALLIERAEPMEGDRFWALVEGLGWGENAHAGHVPLASRLPGLLSLEDAARAAAAADDARWGVHEALGGGEGELAAIVPSEDGAEDFCFHVVGLGRAFYERAMADPGEALEVARRGAYVESFRYVFDHGAKLYPYADYDRALRALGAVAPGRAAAPGYGLVLDYGDYVGVVARRDAGSLYVMTPRGERRDPWPAG